MGICTLVLSNLIWQEIQKEELPFQYFYNLSEFNNK